MRKSDFFFFFEEGEKEELRKKQPLYYRTECTQTRVWYFMDYCFDSTPSPTDLKRRLMGSTFFFLFLPEEAINFFRAENMHEIDWCPFPHPSPTPPFLFCGQSFPPSTSSQLFITIVFRWQKERGGNWGRGWMKLLLNGERMELLSSRERITWPERR